MGGGSRADIVVNDTNLRPFKAVSRVVAQSVVQEDKVCEVFIRIRFCLGFSCVDRVLYPLRDALQVKSFLVRIVR